VLTRDLAVIVEGTAAVPNDDEHDPEGATIAFERAQVSALLGSARERLGEIDEALERVLSGTYGSCGRCGQAIPAERLEARPFARFCVACLGTRWP
jgi:DnaK suppressor protein